MKERFGVCSNPVVWGKIVWAHSTKVRMLVSGRDERTFDAKLVEIYQSESEAKKAYKDAMLTAERLRHGF